MADKSPAAIAPTHAVLANYHCRTKIRGEDLFFIQEEVAIPVIKNESVAGTQKRLTAAAKKLEGHYREGCFEKRFIGFSDTAAEALLKLQQQASAPKEKPATPAVKYVPPGEAGKGVGSEDVKKAGEAR